MTGEVRVAAVVAALGCGLVAAGQAPRPARDFERTMREYKISPFGYYSSPSSSWGSGAGARPASSSGPRVISGGPPFRTPYEPGGYEEMAGFPPSFRPVAVQREATLSEALLIAALRVLLFAAAAALIARAVPKRGWSEVLDGNNIAMAIVLGAVAIALGIVVSAPLR